MDRHTAIATLEEIALWLELKGENPFKIRAYTNAARALGGMHEDLAWLIESGELAKRKGFGTALVEKLTELVETGKLAYLEDLRAEFPQTLPELLNVPGLGPKKLRLFHQELGVNDLDGLEAACRDGRVAALPGCGEKTAAKLAQGIERLRQYSHLFLYEEARIAAELLVSHLRALPEVTVASVAGSVRRGKEVTKDIDLLAASADPVPVMDAFTGHELVVEIVAKGRTKSTVLLRNAMQADLRVVPPAVFPFALHHFTGSREHNVAMRQRALARDLSLSEWGLFPVGSKESLPATCEADIFAHLGLREIPPELREDRGEIEYAEQQDFPPLVNPEDYRGLLHCHSTDSDGGASIPELITRARQAGHAFLGITDHSRSEVQANGMSAERMLLQAREIRDRDAAEEGFRLFAGVECDILPDGSLDYPDSVLEALDYVIVSVHSSFAQSEQEMTRRIIRAIEHPASRILGHPTGRLLLRREPYAVDMMKVIDAAAANNVAIELNCHPYRLDMDWRLWRHARERGVRCSLNSDAHGLDGFHYIASGIRFCRKGWLTAADIVNCWEPDRVAGFLAGA